MTNNSVITVTKNEKTNPILSVLIITKNEVKYIKDWFDDIDKQTIRNKLEIIACDSSTDGTEKILLERADKVAYCSTCKFANARNKCSKLGKADLFLFTDVDIRYLTPTFFDDAIKYFKEHNMDVGSIGTVLQPDGTLTHPASENRLSGQFILIKKDVLNKAGGFGKFMGIFNTWEDIALTQKLYAKGYRIRAIPMTIKHLRPQKKWMVLW